MPRETPAQKAQRLVDRGRVRVWGRNATVRGDNGTYELTWRGTCWQCPCGSRRTRCSHIAAVEIVTAQQRQERQREEREQRTQQEAQRPMAQQQQFQIRRAVKYQIPARIALVGPPGSGKTYSALLLAYGLLEGNVADGDIIVVDSEHRSSERYADKFNFDILELSPETVPYNTYHPDTYTAIIGACVDQGCKVLIIDSLSHAWMGKDGALEAVDKLGGKFSAWNTVTPQQRAMVEAILAAPPHIIATMRSKVEYLVTTNDKGKQTVEKVGLRPIQRDDVEYEFDVVGSMDARNDMSIVKTRVMFLTGQVLKPTVQLGTDILRDLNSGAPAQEQPKQEAATQPAPAPQQQEAAAPAAAPAAGDGEPWSLSAAQDKAIRERMGRLQYAPEVIDEQIAQVQTEAQRDVLVHRIKRELAELKRRDESGEDATTEEGGGAPAQEAPPASPGGSVDGADGQSGAVAPPADENATQGATGATGDGGDRFDFDANADATGKTAPLVDATPAAAAPLAAELLRDAKALVAAGGVAPDVRLVIASSDVLRAKLAAEWDLDNDEQDALLDELEVGPWADLRPEERLAVLWLAEEKSKEAG